MKPEDAFCAGKQGFWFPTMCVRERMVRKNDSSFMVPSLPRMLLYVGGNERGEEREKRSRVDDAQHFADMPTLGTAIRRRRSILVPSPLPRRLPRALGLTDEESKPKSVRHIRRQSRAAAAAVASTKNRETDGLVRPHAVPPLQGGGIPVCSMSSPHFLFIHKAHTLTLMLLLGSSRNEIGKSGVTKYVRFLYELSMGRMVLSSKKYATKFFR